jgi:Cu(I)/Ag(I) efflux system membrane protein CusA/SilA
MRRIAAPMVGGMLTTTLLCLLVLPVIYGFVLQRKESRVTIQDISGTSTATEGS